VWRGKPDFPGWLAGRDVPAEDSPACPSDCGTCSRHLNSVCCVVLDITERCNLRCPYCFAAAGDGRDTPLKDVYAALEDMCSQGIRFIHLSGGEPTVHDDLESIVSCAAKMGFQYIQLNTNGLRLAQEREYAQKLCEAGLSSVFLQFDGTDDEIYRTVRGRDLFALKKRAIDNCDKAQLGVVLVPTVIPGVNDQNLGDIVSFALNAMPAVKGVHFQPVTYIGRYMRDNRPRITLPEILQNMEAQTKQTKHSIRVGQFAPSACDSPICGFHGEFQKKEEKLVPLFSKNDCCCNSSLVERVQNHVKNRWSRARKGDYPAESIDAFLKERNDSVFSISGMAFQDRDNLDTERLMQCTLHVYKSGKIIPFCVWHNVKKSSSQLSFGTE
jgi:uncharacterized radical SAM superfamily Fe-S cluster-containing enzyme